MLGAGGVVTVFLNGQVEGVDVLAANKFKSSMWGRYIHR
jgi:hypothetical protein